MKTTCNWRVFMQDMEWKKTSHLTNQHDRNTRQNIWRSLEQSGLWTDCIQNYLSRGQCTMSEYGHSTATWHVDLGKVHKIAHIVMYFPYEKCKFGWFGSYCENKCSENCRVPGKCDWITGLCEGGCQAGWESPECDKKCDDGKFGLGCTEFCGNCRLIEIEEMEYGKCRHVDGVCIYGCNPGYYGDRCLQHCPNGFYGDKCSLQCPVNCTYCHIETGVCEECYPGFTGPDCLSTCEPGRYAIGCYQRRSPFCNTPKCDFISGACVDGCKTDWEGMQCLECTQSHFIPNVYAYVNFHRFIILLHYKIKIPSLIEI
nr:cell death abnormality protein 1-like isoform X2 [Crassostrea gigas]